MKLSASKLIAFAVVALDIGATVGTIILCYIAVFRGYLGTLPFLTALIGALQAGTAIVLNGYYSKAKAENQKGGITYDAAMGDKRTI